MTQDRFGFPPTDLMLLESAQRDERRRGQYLTRYYPPVRAFFSYLIARSRQFDADADDLTQTFLMKELERCVLAHRFDPQKGSFRGYLKKAMENHWLMHLRREKDRHRLVFPQDEAEWDHEIARKIPDAMASFDQTYLEEARDWIEQALAATRAICARKGKAMHFEIFVAHYLPAPGLDPSWEAIAVRYGLADGRTARNRAETATRHFLKALRDCIGLTDDPRNENSDKLREVLAYLGGER